MAKAKRKPNHSRKLLCAFICIQAVTLLLCCIAMSTCFPVPYEKTISKEITVDGVYQIGKPGSNYFCLRGDGVPYIVRGPYYNENYPLQETYTFQMFQDVIKPGDRLSIRYYVHYSLFGRFWIVDAKKGDAIICNYQSYAQKFDGNWIYGILGCVLLESVALLWSFFLIYVPMRTKRRPKSSDSQKKRKNKRTA